MSSETGASAAPPGASSGSGSGYACSISGRDTVDPVVTPSGYVCDRRLLLTKLTENGGVDPFSSDDDITLDESQLVSIKIDKRKKPAIVPPPRPASHSSFPSLLQSMQTEHDSLLLELFDTRRALEETRMELSQALYQNDAAVRVIARVCLERDGAREELARMATAVPVVPTVAPTPAVAVEQEPEPASATAAEAMEVDDEAPAAAASAAKRPKLEEAAESPVPPKPQAEAEEGGGIPKSDLDVMIGAWKKLSSGRRKKSKQSKGSVTEGGPSPDDLSKFEMLRSRNLHRTNKPGITCLSVLDGDGGIVATGGRDRSVVLYDSSTEKIADTLNPGFRGEIADVDSVALGGEDGDGGVVVAAGCADGTARVFFCPSGGDENERYINLGGVGDVKESDAKIVGADLHPTGRYLIAAGSDGDVRIARIDLPTATAADGGGGDVDGGGGGGGGGGVEVLTTLRNELVGKPLKDGADGEGGEVEVTVTVTCGGLHPDGLIYGVGTSSGELRIWDLKTQKLASTLAGHSGHVTSLDFSENGYHFASSSSTGEVFVWDLRKLKKIATLNEKPAEGEGGGEGKGEENEGGGGWYVGDSVNCVAFDQSGRYLAYAGENGTRVTVVKEWGHTASFPPPSTGKKKKGGRASKSSGEASVAWGKGQGGGSGGTGGNVVIVTATGVDRALKFWGLPQQDAPGGADMEEDAQGGGEDSKAET